MSREVKVRRVLIILFAIALIMPVYNAVLNGQDLHLTIFTHAVLGNFMSIFWPIVVLAILYIVNYQQKLLKIAD